MPRLLILTSAICIYCFNFKKLRLLNCKLEWATQVCSESFKFYRRPMITDLSSKFWFLVGYTEMKYWHIYSLCPSLKHKKPRIYKSVTYGCLLKTENHCHCKWYWSFQFSFREMKGRLSLEKSRNCSENEFTSYVFGNLYLFMFKEFASGVQVDCTIYHFTIMHQVTEIVSIDAIVLTIRIIF